MDQATVWRGVFANWPESLPQRGVIVTTFGEQIVFVKFLLAEHVLMIERMAPDTVGGRRVLLTYDAIAAVKVTDPVRDDVFLGAGYQPVEKSAKKASPRAERAATTDRGGSSVNPTSV